MATSPDVDTLEREAAEARTRLAGTLDRLTSPETQRAVKQEMTDYAQSLKTQALDYVQQKKDEVLGAGRSRAQGFTDDLKQRALSQPLGLALIGAGVAWRLYKHPPITTVLLGTGIALLMKGDGGAARRHFRAYHDPYNPEHPAGYVPGGVAGYGYPVEESAPGSSITDRAGAAALQAGITARHLGESAQAIASDVKTQVSGAVESTTTSITNAAEAAMTTVSNTTESTRTAVMDAVETARTTVSDAVSSTRATASDMARRTTSTIAHTADEAARRARGLAGQAQANPLVLGALGVLVGTALVYSLRSSEAFERPVAGSRRAPERNASRNTRSGTRNGGGRRPARSSDRGSSTGEGIGDLASRASEAAGSVTSRASEAAGGIASSAAEAVSGAASAAGRVLGAAGETVSSSASGAYGAASSALRSTADVAWNAGRRAPEAADRVQQQLSELGERYPLLLGAVSLAIGAAVGGSLRLSESENRLMGAASDRLKQRAKDMAEQQFGVAREAAEHFAGELGSHLRTGGQPQDTSADFETVIGGGKPSVAQAPGNGQRAPG